MPTLRAIKTLNEVESGTLDGLGLESRLSNQGHLAEFYSLLSTRSQTNRIASNTLTMTAMSVSAKAHKAIFESTRLNNTSAALAISNSLVAMNKISISLDALNIAIENRISWDLFINSPHYENNIKTIVTLFAGLNPGDYANLNELISDPAATYQIAQNENAMEALVSSEGAMDIVVETKTAMEDIVAKESAFTILANNHYSVHALAGSTIGITTVTDAARSIIVTIPAALIDFASHESVWVDWMSTSETLYDTIYDILLILTEVNGSTFETTQQIFADPIPMNKIASSTAAMIAILNEPATLSLFSESSEISIALTNPISMGLIADNQTLMLQLIEGEGTFITLISSALSRKVIFESTVLIDKIEVTPSAIAALEAISVEVLAPTLPDGKPGEYQDFGFSGKMLMLAARMNSIVATTTQVEFRGNPMYGSNAGTTNPYAGKSASSGYSSHIAAYTDMEWDAKVSTATAAAQVYVRYVDFN
jgi:hypothetical protein